MRFRAPIRRRGDGFELVLGDAETEMIDRLLGELGELLDDDGDEAAALLDRLFPTVYPDDPELEAEYQRLMRPELIESKRSAIAEVRSVLTGDAAGERLDEAQFHAFMQGLNSVRLVLGTMLGITDDEAEEVTETIAATAEYALYGYLSWLLEHAVTAVTQRL